MPAVSQAQRGFLAHKFGPAWMKRHHFANKGKLPEYKHKTKKMSDPSETVQFGIGETLGKLWGKTPWKKAQAETARIAAIREANRLRSVGPNPQPGWLYAGNGNYIKDSKYKMNDPSKTIEFGRGDILSREIPQWKNYIPKRLLGSAGKSGVNPFTGAIHPNRLAAMDLLTKKMGRQPLGPFEKPAGIRGYLSDTSKLIRLAQIDNQLDSIVRFAYDDNDDNDDPQKRSSLLGTTAKAGALVGAGVGGTLAHQAIQGAGGYGEAWSGAKQAWPDAKRIFSGGMAGKPAGDLNVAGKAISGLGKVSGQVGKYASMGYGKLKGLLSKIKFSSQTGELTFDEHILEPASAEAVPHTKIIQEQFPAGISPAAALRMPFPELMRFLKGRNILQQQFSKIEKLIEIDSKVNQLIQFADLTGKTNWKQQSPATNLRRGLGMGFLAGGPYGAVGGGIAAGAYGKRGVIYKKRDPWGHSLEGGLGSIAGGAAGGLLGAIGGERGAIIGRGLGTIGGFAGGYGLGAHHTLMKRQAELKRGQIFSAKMQRLIQLNSGLDDLIEFEFTEKAKKKFEEAKEKIKAKFQKKKGHKSHGGGT